MNCLISRTGRITECDGGVHHIVCYQQLGMTLDKFFEFGGIRVLGRQDIMAIEFYKSMTTKQKRIVNKLLKQQPIYQLIFANKIITKYRPIKSLPQ